ncbi:hypothetical protein [Gordonia sp. OPL2]|uniref:hypothetical protein n=1 Tax=Gordonia sp. OPL2 TaxID=2486274 RepID=UPI001655DFFC|nr:hypothetical protein [Gordonia sp. OPL2]
MIPPIALKINLDADIANAVSALIPPAANPIRRNIWFAEAHPGIDGSTTPLLSSRLIIRIRSGDQDDISVKLRPCTTAELPDRWSREFVDGDARYRIEADWSGPQRLLAASVVSGRPAGSMAAQITGTDPVSLLDATQRQFVVACTAGGVPIDHLVAIGPIASMTWPDIDLDGAPVTVERWTIADLDMLEVTMRLRPRPADTTAGFETFASARLSDLENTVCARGAQICAMSKTARVLHTFGGSGG